MDDGPGTVPYRFRRLMEELDKRFPGVVNPCLSDPPEPKLLRAIDRLLALEKHYSIGNEWPQDGDWTNLVFPCSFEPK